MSTGNTKRQRFATVPSYEDDIRPQLQSIIQLAFGRGLCITAMVEELDFAGDLPLGTDLVAPLGPAGMHVLFGRVSSGWRADQDETFARMLAIASLGRRDITWQEYANGGGWLISDGLRRANPIEGGHLVTCGRQMLVAAANLRFETQKPDTASIGGAE